MSILDPDKMRESDFSYDRAWGVVFGLLAQVHPEWDLNRTTDETVKLCDYIKRGRDMP